MNGEQLADRLQLYNEFAIDDQIRLVTQLDPNAVIDHGQSDLPGDGEAMLRQLVAEAFLVR